MNQRQALETLVINVREHEPEDREVLKALKWGDKRLQVLSDREERRKVPIDPDLKSEPLVIEPSLCMEDLTGNLCRGCSGKKRSMASFCPNCYIKVRPGVRKALWGTGLFYCYAYNRALRLLNEMKAAA